jgi:hypothetical protein
MIIVVYQVVGAPIGTYHPSLVIGGKRVHRTSGKMGLPWGHYVFNNTYYVR